MNVIIPFLALLKQQREISNTNPCVIIICLHMYGLIYDPHNDLLPVGLIAQLLGNCIGIAEVRVRIPVQA